MDLNLPFGSAAWEPRWRRRRSERGPISIAVRALLELPDTIVAEILRFVDTGRYLEHSPDWAWAWPTVYGEWAGTQRMVNSQILIRRFWRPTHWKLVEPRDHFTPEYRMIKYTLPPGY